jgi:hypothetical protein
MAAVSVSRPAGVDGGGDGAVAGGCEIVEAGGAVVVAAATVLAGLGLYIPDTRLSEV